MSRLVGRRCDNAGRAVTAYLARRHYAYPALQVAAALGYRGHGGVHNAVVRVESSAGGLQATLEEIKRKLR